MPTLRNNDLAECDAALRRRVSLHAGDELPGQPYKQLPISKMRELVREWSRMADGLASLDFFSDSGTDQNDGYGIDRFRISTPTVVPEPTGLFTLGSGLVGLALRRRK
jgi:hypothetical protein